MERVRMRVATATYRALHWKHTLTLNKNIRYIYSYIYQTSNNDWWICFNSLLWCISSDYREALPREPSSTEATLLIQHFITREALKECPEPHGLVISFYRPDQFIMVSNKSLYQYDTIFFENTHTHKKKKPKKKKKKINCLQIPMRIIRLIRFHCGYSDE